MRPSPCHHQNGGYEESTPGPGLPPPLLHLWPLGLRHQGQGPHLPCRRRVSPRLPVREGPPETVSLLTLLEPAGARASILPAGSLSVAQAGESQTPPTLGLNRSPLSGKVSQLIHQQPPPHPQSWLLSFLWTVWPSAAPQQRHPLGCLPLHQTGCRPRIPQKSTWDVPKGHPGDGSVLCYGIES